MSKELIESLGRRIPAPLLIDFEETDSQKEEIYKREYYSLSESDDDAIGQWLKIAKARGDTRDSDNVLLHLVVELHRKVDELTKLVKNETPEYLNLQNNEMIEDIGHGYFVVKNPVFQEGKKYYGRIDLPVFPVRMVAIFFISLDSRIGKIEMMHERDIKDWDGYITARERALIREKKGLQNG